jgi:hypothetical protein
MALSVNDCYEDVSLQPALSTTELHNPMTVTDADYGCSMETF